MSFLAFAEGMAIILVIGLIYYLMFTFKKRGKKLKKSKVRKKNKHL